MKLEGTFTALVTPFRHDAVDIAALEALVERQIAGGISGLVPCGTTGESVTLDAAEFETVVHTVVRAAKGRVPVFAGTGTNDTKKTVALSRKAHALGADGLLVVTPYYNRPTQAGLEAHFRAVAAATPLPIMLYNIPGRTGGDLSAVTLGRLADEPTIVAIKEATGHVVRAQEILVRYGDRFAVFSGDDALTLPMMALGAKGVVSVTSNLLPAEVSKVTRDALRGDFASARRQHLALVPVHEAMFTETNPGPIKGILARAGLIADEIRLPMVWPNAETIEALATIISQRGFSLPS